MRKILGILLLFFPFLALFSCSSNSSYYKVIAVHDGDTFTLSNNYIIRLYGCDTPEVSNQFNDFHPTSGIESMYGAEATSFTSKEILNKEIKLIEMGSDQYGRHVGRIQYHGDDLTINLIKNGLARVAYIQIENPKLPYYTDDFDYYRLLLEAQYQAWKNHLGFWLHEDQFKTIFPKA